MFSRVVLLLGLVLLLGVVEGICGERDYAPGTSWGGYWEMQRSFNDQQRRINEENMLREMRRERRARERELMWEMLMDGDSGIRSFNEGMKAGRGGW